MHCTIAILCVAALLRAAGGSSAISEPLTLAILGSRAAVVIELMWLWHVEPMQVLTCNEQSVRHWQSHRLFSCLLKNPIGRACRPPQRSPGVLGPLAAAFCKQTTRSDCKVVLAACGDRG